GDRLPLLRRAGEEDRVGAVEEDAGRDELGRLAAAEMSDGEPVAPHRHLVAGDLDGLPPRPVIAVEEGADASRQEAGRVLARRGRTFADGHDVGPAVAVDVADQHAPRRESGGQSFAGIGEVPLAVAEEDVDAGEMDAEGKIHLPVLIEVGSDYASVVDALRPLPRQILPVPLAVSQEDGRKLA